MTKHRHCTATILNQFIVVASLNTALLRFYSTPEETSDDSLPPVHVSLLTTLASRIFAPTTSPTLSILSSLSSNIEKQIEKLSTINVDEFVAQDLLRTVYSTSRSYTQRLTVSLFAASDREILDAELKDDAIDDDDDDDDDRHANSCRSQSASNAHPSSHSGTFLT